MKNTFAAAACFAMLTVSNYAYAIELNSPVYIDQISGSRFASIDTAAIVGPLSAMAQAMPRPTGRMSNLALISQEGAFNSATVDQQGRGNVGLIRQIGYSNMAQIQQSGRGHNAMIFQQGRNNTAIISQR